MGKLELELLPDDVFLVPEFLQHWPGCHLWAQPGGGEVANMLTGGRIEVGGFFFVCRPPAAAAAALAQLTLSLITLSAFHTLASPLSEQLFCFDQKSKHPKGCSKHLCGPVVE